MSSTILNDKKIAILLILQNTSQILENMRKLLVWNF